MSRVGAAVAAGVREYRRTPVLLALLVFLPVYVVLVFQYAVPNAEATLYLDSTVTASMDATIAAFMTPMAGALLAGIAGLFLMGSAADADGRLVLAGYRPHEVILGRLCLLAGVSAVATGAAVAATWLTFEPAQPGWFVAAALLAALVYGMLGVVVGSLLSRLAGVYLLLFGPMVDMFLYQNPLSTETPAVATVLPGHYPLAVALDAAFTGSADPSAFALGLAYLAGVTLLATATFYRALR
ncbi:MAG: hypothetical protein ABEJ68_09400 [Halobacteriaceae archaeon]